MALIFFDHTALGPAERRLIRSHVMQGKNAGRPRPSTKKPRRSKQPAIESSELAATQDRFKTREILRGRRLLWNDLALTSFPQPPGNDSMKLLRQCFTTIGNALHPPAFCVASKIMDSVWMQYILLDEAYFYAILAIAASYVDSFLGKTKMSAEALHHLSKAYALTNQKLSGPDAISDRAIAVVTTLAVYQNTHNQQGTSMVHFEGLLRMVQLRGGMDRLAKDNRALVQKPWRLDLEFAIQTGTPTHFVWHELPQNPVFDDYCSMQASRSTFGSSIRCSEMDSDLLTIAFDVTTFTRTLNSRFDGNKLDPLDFHETILSLLNRLINFAPLAQPRLGFLDNLLHLTLIALLTTLLPPYSHHRTHYGLLVERLSCTLISSDPETFHKPKAFLWSLMISGISVLESETQWLPSLVDKTSKRLNLRTWADVKEVLDDFGWIHTLHDEPGRVLWIQATTKAANRNGVSTIS